MHDPYVYPGTDILVNKLDIQDPDVLGDIEDALYVAANSRGLPKGKFNLAHLQEIHKEIFSDLYTWAGSMRTVDISKGYSTFCRNNFIVNEANKLFKNLANENYLATSKLDPEKFISRFAHYYAEINVIHPFREGNGRATRLFFEQLAIHNNYKLDLSNIDRKVWIEASIDSFNCDNTKLESVFRQSLTPIKEISKDDLLKQIFEDLNKILDKQYFGLSKEHITVNKTTGAVNVYPSKQAAEANKNPDIDIVHANSSKVSEYAQILANNHGIEFVRQKSLVLDNELTITK
jgi:cell filamentation protein